MLLVSWSLTKLQPEFTKQEAQAIQTREYLLPSVQDRIEKEHRRERSFLEEHQDPYEPTAEALTDKHIRIWAMLFAQREELNVCGNFGSYVGGDAFFFENRYPNLYKFGDGYLIELLCDHAYNRTLQYFLYKGFGNITPLQFEEIDYESWMQRDIITLKTDNPSTLHGVRTYNPEQKILSIYGKGSGGAVDGAFSKYQWSEAEQRFILLEYRYKSGYDPPFNPRNYPLIYQRKNS